MTDRSPSYLSGKILIAMPGIGDPRFERSVIYLCAHSEEGAMGLIVNQPAGDLKMPDFLEQLEILAEGEGASLPAELRGMPVQIGGPVESGRGFVLHSADYHASDATMPVSETVGLTATLEVLRALARGEGPHHALVALGYSGWGPGQLESELLQNGWLHCDADDALIFGDNDAKYGLAMKRLGIDPRMLSSAPGHG